MCKQISFLFCLMCTQLLSAQIRNFISYSVQPTALGAKQIEVVFKMKLPSYTTSNPENISGVIDFSLQIIDKKDADNLSIKGKEIAFFIEKININDATEKSTFLNIPKNILLKENLPDNQVYRLTHKDNVLLLLDAKNATYEKRIPITSKNNTLDIGGNEIASDINFSFINRPTVITRGTDFELHTEITNSNILTSALPKVKFEIHIVEEKDVLDNRDTHNQKFVSHSGESVSIPFGTTTKKFKLKSPEIPTKFLPKGKKYRVRLLNDSSNVIKAHPFPFELTVTKNKFEKNIFSEKSPVSISPNPVTNHLIVHSSVKSSSYKIYDISGALVKEQKNLRRIVVSDLKPGVYLLATDSGVTRFTKK